MKDDEKALLELDQTEIAILEEIPGYEGPPETINELKLNFGQYIVKSKDLVKEGKALKINGVEDVANMELARTIRLSLRGIRTELEATRKELKKDIVRKGKAIDGMANIIKAIIEPVEEKLKADEEFIEKEKQRIEGELIERRKTELLKYSSPEDIAFFSLGTLPEENFQTLLENMKLAFQKKEEVKIQLEKEKIKKEQEELLKNQKLEEENKRIKKEAEAKRKAIEKEKKEAEKKRKAAEKKVKEAEAETARIKKKMEADRKKAEDEKKAIIKKAEEEKAKAKKETAKAVEKIMESAPAPGPPTVKKGSKQKDVAYAYINFLKKITIPKFTGPGSAKLNKSLEGYKNLHVNSITNEFVDFFGPKGK